MKLVRPNTVNNPARTITFVLCLGNLLPLNQTTPGLLSPHSLHITTDVNIILKKDFSKKLAGLIELTDSIGLQCSRAYIIK